MDGLVFAGAPSVGAAAVAADPWSDEGMAYLCQKISTHWKNLKELAQNIGKKKNCFKYHHSSIFVYPNERLVIGNKKPIEEAFCFLKKIDQYGVERVRMREQANCL